MYPLPPSPPPLLTLTFRFPRPDLIPAPRHKCRHLLWAHLPRIPAYPDWPLSSLPSLIAAFFFGGMNVFLFIVPLPQPQVIAKLYISLPY
ncbi:hypothetical protein CVT25_011479 [Psilocybe cyanescens]|uniref:Uncharacterized protein n=1 Tax=Psilocybe cyanescens TaxID=93625 RepID=A0A409XA31_PSICY|nr:hypothetical protein CVT25_011479 [Psilocybe cyanescens]